MAFRNVLILRKPPPGPAFGRPEDRLRGGLDGPTVLPQPIGNRFEPIRARFGPEAFASRYSITTGPWSATTRR
jgi:hypothetical protein